MPLAVGYQWAYTECTCGQCGVSFALTDAMYQARRTDRETFYCPNGHARAFLGKTPDQERIAALEAAIAREKANAESAQRARSWAESRARGANIQAGKAKAAQRRLIARVHAGVCPHCNRTFKQLAAHMKAKH